MDEPDAALGELRARVLGGTGVTASLKRYAEHLDVTANWLLRSLRHGQGGSCAHFSPLVGWSPPYPETTGYLIPTLLDLHRWDPGRGFEQAAFSAGAWLRSIQLDAGPWQKGLYRADAAEKGLPSVFNTAQILKGMVALHRASGDAQWLACAERGAIWLAQQMRGDDWGPGDYRARATPSYYSQVAWPLLEVWALTGEARLRRCAERFLALVLTRIQDNGAIRDWGFAEGEPGPTHTIAYTLRGLLESARLLQDWDRWAAPIEASLENFRRRAELGGGRLAGWYDLNWQPRGRGVCLTGSAQLALCLLIWEAQVADLRIVNAAAKLLDQVCRTQFLSSPLAGVAGAVAGSWPIWGSYMTLRFPNWAAKYHCDALLRMIARIVRELEGPRLCASS